MVKDWDIIWEFDFKIVDKKELDAIKSEGSIDNAFKNKLWKKGNLKDDLIQLWFLDYDNLSDEEKKIFDELENEKRDDFYELD